MSAWHASFRYRTVPHTLSEGLPKGLSPCLLPCLPRINTPSLTLMPPYMLVIERKISSMAVGQHTSEKRRRPSSVTALMIGQLQYSWPTIPRNHRHCDILHPRPLISPYASWKALVSTRKSSATIRRPVASRAPRYRCNTKWAGCGLPISIRWNCIYAVWHIYTPEMTCHTLAK